MSSFENRANELITPREQEVLRWLFHAKSNWEIAAVLNVSEFTIKNHVQNIIRKLGANNRQHAVVKAINAGLIPCDKGD